MRGTLRSLVEGFPRRPEAGLPGDPGLLAPGSVARRVNGETALLLGGGRALLLQIAHPLVAAGVVDHSNFEVDPFERLWRTLDATLRVSFGDAEQSRRAAERITAIHRSVTGERGGEQYEALDPELLLWVHATLVDSAIVTYERFVGRFGPGARARYYAEMRPEALALHVPEQALPRTYEEFCAYFARATDSLRVSDEARGLAHDILYPPVSATLRPVAAVMRQATVGMLPDNVRREYGLAWSAARRRALDLMGAGARTVHPVMPGIVRRWPHARIAERRYASERR
jgi:uncharacterized protein (DUF2236 family)